MTNVSKPLPLLSRDGLGIGTEDVISAVVLCGMQGVGRPLRQEITGRSLSVF